MKVLTLVFAALLFCSPSIAGLTINLEEASYCDPIYTPDTCRIRPGESASEYGIKSNLYVGTGINLANNGRTRQINRVVTIMGNGQPPADRGSTTNTLALPRIGPSQEQLNSGGPPQASNGNSNGLDFGNNPQAASTQPAVQVTQPNGLTNVNGVLYREEPKKAKIESESETAPGQLGTAINTLPQSGEPGGVKTKSGSGGGDRSPTSAAGAGSAMAANPYQGYESSPGPGSAGNMAGQLKALAAALGKSVYAALGISEESEGNRSYASLGKNSGKSVNGAILGPDGKPLPKLGKINKNLLKDQFGRYITSSKKLEFGGANELMFQSMCGHYAAYASQNRIPYDRAGCEPANDDKY